MITIRLHRIGKTNQPSFKVVVIDKKSQQRPEVLLKKSAKLTA